jgi:hypothetical protein
MNRTLRQMARTVPCLMSEHDIRFWLDILVREGGLKPGQFGPEDIATNKYNANARLARH